MTRHPGLFSRYKPLRGKAWLRSVPADDRRVFSGLGLAWQREEYCLQSLGGKARARRARRDARGRFVANG